MSAHARAHSEMLFVGKSGVSAFTGKKSKSKDLILVILKYFEVDWLRWTRNTGDF